MEDFKNWIQQLLTLKLNEPETLQQLQHSVRNQIRGGIHAGDRSQIRIGGVDAHFHLGEGDTAREVIEEYQRVQAVQAEYMPLGQIEPGLLNHSKVGERTILMQDVHVSVNAQLLAEQTGRAWRAEQVAEKARPLDEVIGDKDHRLLVLKGLAGTGKTTFVNHLLRQRNKDPSRLPEPLRKLPFIHIRLRELNWRKSITENPVWQALRCSLGEVENVARIVEVLKQHALRTGAYLLVDGLDELAGDDQERLAFLVRLAELADNELFQDTSRVLLTTRPHALSDGLPFDLARFSQAELLPLARAQQTQFVENWWRHLSIQKWPQRMAWSNGDWERRKRELLASLALESVSKLAERPLWLTLMIILQVERPGSMPTDSVALLDELTDLMLRRWPSWRLTEREAVDADSLTRYFENAKYREALESLAWRLQAVSEKTKDAAHLDTEALESDLGGKVPEESPRVFLQYLSEGAGLLEPDQQGRIGFHYRVFQEFLAACHLVRQADFEVQFRHCCTRDQAHWRELLGYSVGILRLRQPEYGLAGALTCLLPEERPDSLNRNSMQVADWLVLIRCAQGLSGLGLSEHERKRLEKPLGRLRHWLVELIETGQLDPRERAEAGDALGAIGDPRFHGREKYRLPALYRGEPEKSCGFIKIPAGEFLMGSDKAIDKDAFDDECINGKPHPQQLDEDFWIGRYPVTVGQYACFVDDGGYDRDEFWSSEGRAWRDGSLDAKLRADAGRDSWMNELLTMRPPAERREPWEWTRQQRTPTRPVIMICWYETEAYCNWLNRRLHASGMVDWISAGSEFSVRLPTEREWEKAARTGHEQIEPWRYPWGNEEWTEGRANIKDSKIGHASAVGIYAEGATPLGLHDMAGNVWEWSCSWWSADYPYQADKSEAETAPGGNYRVLRGGSWVGIQRRARCASRVGDFPDYWNDYVGFRVVLSLAVDF
ncbi:MAG: SUMF1/EgtB/PvdO family nonheme iron enzyme [Gammaproteobacteria bacterium]|nr:SUMF1/EgtB/PvdO family nonheme iron enzyme [Gammaproteobacteria bacterium]